MGRKRKELPELKGVEISGVAAEGKAMAKVKLKETDETPIVIFIPYGAPGDIVDIKIVKKKHNYAEARITKMVKPSPMRVVPICKSFGVCGGCKWQHIPYEEQLRFKRRQVVDAMERIAKVEIPEVEPTLGSEKIWGYRNKMEYTFSNKRWKSWEEIRGEEPAGLSDNALGFHIPGSFDKVLHIDKCWLQEEIGDEIRNSCYSFAEKLDKEATLIIQGINAFYDIKNNKGFLRTLMIRPTTTGELMVCVVFGDEVEETIKSSDKTLSPSAADYFLKELSEKFPEITTLAWVINRKVNDSIADQEVKIFKGPGFVEEKMGNLKFRISPKSFYQTNSRQAEALYHTASEFAGLFKPNEDGKKPVVYDLYTGAGTIANYVAQNAEKVIGIEYVEDAVEDARINSQINGITNTEFFAGDMKDVLTENFIESHGRPDIMIIDPPRAGMHEDVVDVILKVKPPTIVYVSCNPATQARDIALLDSSYKVTRIQPVDMFPHTHHVENVVKLEKRIES
ncbi:MAG: 23S rRNA (uracil(1939)-C(5))-methyltransferase RlmD [Muribaculaceae bacterium]|nr:23S rRNA (uracil(1939)-C(5))-methyltransferase RlmD [Muribaculaceae bacterium]